jgi:superfamily II DNA or RNA helicase
MTTVNYLIVDECQEYGSKKRVSLLNKFRNVNKKLFLSATPFKSENIIANYNLMRISGQVIYQIPIQELRSKGVLTKNKVLLIYMNHNADRNIYVADEAEENYRLYLRQVITHNFKRNMAIVNTVEICRKLLLKTLVLCTYKKHGSFLQSILGDEFLHGEHSGKEREIVKNNFLKRKGGVLIASDIFKKGITLPEAQVMVNAGGGLERTNVAQKQGRVFGALANKLKSLIVDFIDDYKYFKEHSLNRIAEYEATSTSKDDIIILDTGDGEFYNDLRDFIESWFYE